MKNKGYLSYCECCGEKSVVVKKYYCKRDGRRKVVRFCLNKGCRSRQGGKLW